MLKMGRRCGNAQRQAIVLKQPLMGIDCGYQGRTFILYQLLVRMRQVKLCEAYDTS